MLHHHYNCVPPKARLCSGALFVFNTQPLSCVCLFGPVFCINRQAQARERQFISLKHRVKILSEVSPLSSFCKRFYRACAFTWKEYFFLGLDDSGVLDEEAPQEIRWASTRSSSMAYGSRIDHHDPYAFSKLASL